MIICVHLQELADCKTYGWNSLPKWLCHFSSSARPSFIVRNLGSVSRTGAEWENVACDDHNDMVVGAKADEFLSDVHMSTMDARPEHTWRSTATTLHCASSRTVQSPEYSSYLT